MNAFVVCELFGVVMALARLVLLMVQGGGDLFAFTYPLAVIFWIAYGGLWRRRAMAA